MGKDRFLKGRNVISKLNTLEDKKVSSMRWF